MKKILGLDLGTNSIGWALIEQDFENKYGKILGLGSRIIPMSLDALGEFESGAPIKTQTAERRRLRSTRRLRERHLLRRERLHRVLNILGGLPKHYSNKIDFDIRVGKFLPETEVKLVYDDNGAFIFQKSFNEMLSDFQIHQPELLNRKNKKGEDAKIPYDWTIYYLRKKALKQKIENEELAWLLLHFNQKRGYYQLRGEETDEKPNKLEQFYTLKIVDVTADDAQKGKDKIWYNIILENGWIYRRESKLPLFDWRDKSRDFIVTTEVTENGTVKKDKDGKEKRSFRSPNEDDWQLLKKKTENEIEKSKQTVGEYIYDALLKKPEQKIRGKLVRTIERKFYKDELKQILKKQVELNETLQNAAVFKDCIEELYPHNLQHRSALLNKDFLHLFIEDILYYHRPLRSQKSSISNCPLESRTYLQDGIKKTEPIKCIPKSNPLYQEFRLWQWINNLRFINRDSETDETNNMLQSNDDLEALFDYLNGRKEIDQKTLLKHFKLKESNYRWNYVEDKKYPCNETHAMMAVRLEKVKDTPFNFLTNEKEQELWHVIYSVTDKIEYEKALRSFAKKNRLDEQSFYEAFKKFPPFPSSYGAYSAKAIKKLLPLMRIGRCWNWENIDSKTKERISKLLTGEVDEEIKESVREKIQNKELVSEKDFQGLPEWLAKYVVYDRHSERAETGKWENVIQLTEYLETFKQHSLRNPIVEQVMTETLRVIKDIWKHFGNSAPNFFDEIHIELGRQMKNPADRRKSLTEQITKNENTNLRIKALLAEMRDDPAIENVRPYSPMQQDILKIYEDGVLNSDIDVPEDIEKISRLAQPSRSELQRYKLWLEQKYRSPYTGAIIPLGKLFTPEYEIEHIIPQQRYFDDSLSNKVICESAVNKLKDNQTGLEFIQNHHGQIVDLGLGKRARIFTEAEYLDFVKQHYSKSRTKKNKLMALDIPEKMIERQLNDTRYISKFIMQVLSNIVRADTNDDGVNSKNILATSGQTTSVLRQDWGLDAIWNELILPRFERLNEITNCSHFTVYNDRYQKYLPTVPLELQKGFQKKRIDHRHHALDALVIACATRNHINFLNNQHALDKKKSKEQKLKDRHDLKTLLCDKKYDDNSERHYQWIFRQPWETFAPDAKEKLEQLIVSFKQNLRIINKTVNNYNVLTDGKKESLKQIKGQTWAIRKSLHKDTISGLVSLQKKKNISINSALDTPQNIVDKRLKKQVQKLIGNGYDKKKLLQYLKENSNGQDISKVEIYFSENDNAASRVTLNSSFNQAKIASITDTGIQKILLAHLKNSNNDPEIAFAPEGIEKMNKEIVRLNDGKFHQPIFKVRTYEPLGNKFNIGTSGNKKNKFAEAAKGTNLFFAIYVDEHGKRSYETIPMNLVIERLKQGLSAVNEKNEKGSKLLFFLSPNDIVYVPSSEEDHLKPVLNNDHAKGIYKFISCTGNEGHFVPHSYASPILKNEIGSNNKSQNTLNGVQIKEVCQKLRTDRIGNITLV